MNFCKSLCFSFIFVLIYSALLGNAYAQGRERIVENESSAAQTRISNPSEKTSPENLPRQIPTLTSKIIVQNQTPLVKKTVSSQPVNLTAGKSLVRNYSAVFSGRLLHAIQERIGTPYLYGSTGPNTYDCSGLVWSVFQEAGFYFERSSARTLWQNSQPVEGDDRFKLGTLVFFNGLGHMGIVADDKGFYHASSSQGVTYSTFDGYWSKRIVGFRRLALASN